MRRPFESVVWSFNRLGPPIRPTASDLVRPERVSAHRPVASVDRWGSRGEANGAIQPIWKGVFVMKSKANKGKRRRAKRRNKLRRERKRMVKDSVERLSPRFRWWRPRGPLFLIPAAVRLAHHVVDDPNYLPCCASGADDGCLICQAIAESEADNDLSRGDL